MRDFYINYSLRCTRAFSEKRTVGLFWLNVAETWIDISSNVADKVSLVSNQEIC